MTDGRTDKNTVLRGGWDEKIPPWNRLSPHLNDPSEPTSKPGCAPSPHSVLPFPRANKPIRRYWASNSPLPQSPVTVEGEADKSSANSSFKSKFKSNKYQARETLTRDGDIMAIPCLSLFLEIFFCIMVSVCLIDRLHSQGDGRLLFRHIKGRSKVNRCHRSCVCVTPHPCPRVSLEKDLEKSPRDPRTSLRQGRATHSCDEWKGVALELPRNKQGNAAVNILLGKRRLASFFLYLSYLAETFKGKEHSLSYLYQGEEDPQ